jgi:Major tropism determinant N-terminal domain
MTVLKYFNPSTSIWEQVTVGAKGDTGNTGPTGPIGVAFANSAPSNHDQLWADTSTSNAQIAVFDGGTPAAQINSVRMRRGTASAWTTTNPILDNGEFGYDSTNNKFKIGDGTLRWSALSYVTAIADLNNPTLTGTITMTDATVVGGTISGGSA